MSHRITRYCLLLLLLITASCEKNNSLPPEEPILYPLPQPRVLEERQPPATNLQLNPSEETLTTIGSSRRESLLEKPPARRSKEQPAQKEVSVGGSLLTGEDDLPLHKSVQGAKIQVDIKLD